MECPNCQTDSAGRYCSQCGAALPLPRCPACEHELPVEAKFCTRCGSPVDGRTPGAVIAWTATAILAGLFLVVFVLPGFRRDASGGTPDLAAAPSGVVQSAAGAGAGGMSPPPLTGTPREQADRLFNRVMESFAAGDTSGGRFFLPMAIDAYALAAPLDADGSFHLSLLHAANGNAAAGLAVAEAILEDEPDHLLGLAAAAQAAAAIGDTASARTYFRRYLAVYETESARADVAEYAEHAPMLPFFRDEAERFLAE